ncbi:hypothetical protein V0M98_33920 (plasmid) [Pseudomonas silesiensis]|uniref:hypothetical protein n=1 Tax=Pseudomonas silesiensis TaxID=1853130 RepID=UPI0030CE78F2
MNNKKITGVEAVTLVKKVLAADGLERNGFRPGAGITGWTNKTGKTGFSVSEYDAGKLEWNIVVSGAKHFYYISDNKTSYPDKPESLAGEIKLAFSKIGLDVTHVKVASFDTGHFDDINYKVVTQKPDWLERTPARFQQDSSLSL